MDYYIERIHRVLDLSFVTEPHAEVDVTSIMSSMKLREFKVQPLAQWNNIRVNGYYTKDIGDSMLEQMEAA